MTKKININIDHIATLRNARGGSFPDPIEAVKIIENTKAKGITIHLREDRRHIKDEDAIKINKNSHLPLNFEMAATKEMLQIALDLKPKSVCIVPEKREEITTEGGLDVIKNQDNLSKIINKLGQNNILTSLFIEPDEQQMIISKKIGADIIEIHTGKYCNLAEEFGINHEKTEEEFDKIKNIAKKSLELGLECHAGHGINYQTIVKINQIAQISTLHIGHFAICQSIFVGLENVINKLIELTTIKE
ncbi:pyridoxine 5'-phosphate synthase [Rickettsiales bacterium]|nr:pyridoxine 5'-phosphate synthase [Rickettsiales bacterium]